MFDMLDNGKIMSANTSKAVENIATNEKDYQKCSLCNIACMATTCPVTKVEYYRTHLV